MDPNTWPPELYTLIGSFLSQSDLAICSRVCKPWRDIFEPLIWADITLHRQPPPHSQTVDLIYHAQLAKEVQRKTYPLIEPSEDQLVLHGSLVRFLRFRNSVPATVLRAAASCDRLCELNMTGWTNVGESDSSLLLIAEVITNSWNSLKRIQISQQFRQFMGEGPAMDNVLTAIAMCGAHLQELTLSGWVVSWSGLEAVMEACPRLEKLVLDRLLVKAFEHRAPGSTPPVFENMRHLQMRSLQGAFLIRNRLDLAHQCPNLTTLLVDSCESVEPIPSGSSWPKLEHLRMTIYHSHQSWYGMTEDDCIKVLEQFPCLLGYSFAATLFGQRAFDRMVDSGVLLTLQEIDLHGCKCPSSPIIQTFLSSCPKLKTLRANYLRATDIEKGQPWVCQDLHVLDLCIVVDPSREGEGRIVFDQLARLSNLRCLYLTNDGFQFNGAFRGFSKSRPKLAPQSFSWTLKSGLGALQGLSKLEKLYLPVGGLAKATAKDLQWMLEQWPRLDSIRYQCSSAGKKEMSRIQKMMARVLKAQRKEARVEVF